MARFVPVPDPGGSLDPPRRNPPTALATAVPEPERQPTSTRASGRNRFLALRQLAVAALDLADEAARTIRGVLQRIG